MITRRRARMLLRLLMLGATERALRLGGTCSGEHGVGLGKMKYLTAEHGEALNVMRAIKQTLDPHELMNPGEDAARGRLSLHPGPRSPDHGL